MPNSPPSGIGPHSNTHPATPPALSAGGIAHADFIAGLAKGLAVLESFDTERQRLNATLAAERAGLTRAAARRHLLTLTHLGYLESDGHYFWLSPKVLRFSGSYLSSARLPRVVQATLNRLAAQTGGSFSVAVLDGDESVIVARSANYGGGERAMLPYGLHLGARLPAHATSTGRMMLALLAPQELAHWLEGPAPGSMRELPRLTPNSITDIRELRGSLETARKQDFCQVSEEHELGVHALAIPLRNMKGMALAALNIVSSTQGRTTLQVRQDILPAMLDAARELRGLL
ncbi:IclR family pca regulon transcriptional regulator [Kerstersia gyiorum]|nr:IclR family pca regulon transcriptional regulator [Kerstersia gyiorum]MCP1637437.1 IclR family pca regulon transcriptional regulator [Kerstersia gyiorum]MCP1671587.1 IclR family pca regulon transcriptional regulator [Kerstersia gyiorum]MCP1683139.1 IclR family pca regulon transcriptional regulator [Kerstersia gyiorum]MCP1709768.1 IclR family pca regulon transcriptional regulator [Kerstersia gyiorum]